MSREMKTVDSAHVRTGGHVDRMAADPVRAAHSAADVRPGRAARRGWTPGASAWSPRRQSLEVALAGRRLSSGTRWTVGTNATIAIRLCAFVGTIHVMPAWHLAVQCRMTAVAPRQPQ